MAITQNQVNAWFDANPNAKPEDVANAVQSIGGLEANAGLSGMIANRFSIAEPEVTNYYNAYTAPAGGLSNVVDGKNNVLEDTSNNYYGDSDSNINTGVNTGGLSTITSTVLSPLTKVPEINLPPPDTQEVIKETNAPVSLGNGTYRTSGGVIIDSNGYPVTNTATSNQSAIDALSKQILGSSNTSVWKGEGFGSAEKNAADMAKILSGIGITDIKDFGQITKQVPTYSYDQDGNQTQTGTETVTTYGNKKTGQEVPQTYGERQTGNAFGGTYTGEGNTAYRAQFDANGNPLFYTTGASSSDIGNIAPLLAVASFVPGLQPFAMAAQAAIAIDQGDVIGGLASLAGLGEFTDVATGLRVTNALKNGDTSGLIMSLMQNPTVSNAAGSTMLTDTISLRDASNALNVASNVSSGNYAGALSSAGMLTGSKDTVTAGAALRVVNAINSGNETAIINALGGLSNTINAGNNITNKNVASGLASNVASVAKTAPLSEEDLADLLPDQLAVYQSGGTQGLIDYNRAIKNMTSLTGVKGYDYSGDVSTDETTGGADTSGATRSLTGATTDSDFVNTEYARLKGLGFTKEQISDYFDKLDALTSNLDTTDTTTGNGDLTDAGSLTITGNKGIDTTSGLDSVSNTKATDLGTVNITGNKNIDLGTTTIVGDKPKDLGNVEIVGDKLKDTTVINNDDGTTTTIVIVDNKPVTHTCGEGYHWDEAAQACVEDTKKPVKCGEGYHWDEATQSCVKDTVKDTTCGTGYHWDEASQSCVKDTVVVIPPVVVPPVVTPPKVTTYPLASSAGTPAPKLDSSEQMLKGAPAQKRMELAKLQQLFASLTPEMASVLTERGFAPPKYKEDKIDNTSSEKSDTSVFGNLSDGLFNSKFMASGGSVLDSMMPKYIDAPKYITAAPVVGTGGVDSPLKLAALKHLYQSIGKPMKPLGELAKGGLPAKYAKAAPKGHKPEFITGLTGYYAQGGGTGQSDDIPAMLHDGDYVIDADAVAALGDGSSKAGAQALSQFQSKVPHKMSTGGQAVPAKIADGEYVFPEAFVTAIGGGDNKEGAKRLDAMREELRAHKRSAPTSKIPPKAKSPLDYLRMAKG